MSVYLSKNTLFMHYINFEMKIVIERVYEFKFYCNETSQVQDPLTDFQM